MGWLDFFKSRIETEDKPKTLSLNEADALIEGEVKKREEEIKLIKNSINLKVNKFISDLEEEIKILKDISFEERKEEERVKVVVLESLHSYIDDMNKFSNSLKKIDYENDIGFIFRNINHEIELFSKNSHKKFSRAAILSGNKLAQSEEIIKIFYKDIGRIIESSKKTVENLKGIKKLNELKLSLLELNNLYDNLSKELDKLKKENDTMVGEKKELEEKLMIFKKSNEYITFIEEKLKFKEDKERLKEDAKILKNKIDFKTLLNNFHEIEIPREIIKKYRDDFLDAIEEDKNLEILDLLGSNQKKLQDEIRDLRERNLSLKKSGENVIEIKLNELEISIKDKDFEILNNSNKIQIEDKKLEKFNENKIILQNEIKMVMGNILNDLEGVKVV